MPEQAAPWLASALEALGLGAHEREVASAVARTPGMTAGDLAKSSRLHRNQVYRALQNLEAAGILGGVDQRPRRFHLAQQATLRDRLEGALAAYEAARLAIREALQRLEGAPAPASCRPVPAATLRAEVERFGARQLVGCFDTWPLDHPALAIGPRTITLPGRSIRQGVRRIDAAPPVRYILAREACLFIEGPGRSPDGFMVTGTSVSVFRDHFEQHWDRARA